MNCRSLLSSRMTSPSSPSNQTGATDSTDASSSPLEKLLALKKAGLASLQAHVRSQIVAHAPGQQYCHVTVAGVPAGSCCNLGNSSTCNLVLSCKGASGGDGAEVTGMMRLFRGAAEAKRNVRTAVVVFSALHMIFCCLSITLEFHRIMTIIVCRGFAISHAYHICQTRFIQHTL